MADVRGFTNSGTLHSKNMKIVIKPTYNSFPNISCDPEIPIEWNPQEPTSAFTGRSKFLEELIKRIQSNKETTGPTTIKSQAIIIQGIGGVGKTETVRQYVLKNKASYFHIIWIDSENSLALRTSFIKLATLKLAIQVDGLTDSELAIQVYQILLPKPTLIIFDGAKSFSKEDGIGNFYPSYIENSWTTPTIIITTRFPRYQSSIWSTKPLILEGLDESEIVELLKQSKIPGSSIYTNLLAKEFHKLCNGLPLVVQQLIQIYQRQKVRHEITHTSEYSAQEFLNSLNNNSSGEHYLKEPPADNQEYEPALKLFTKTFNDLLLSSSAIVNKQIVLCFQSLAYFIPSNISKRLLFYSFINQDQVQGHLTELLGRMLSYNLLTLRCTHFEIHPVIQQCLKHYNRLEKEGRDPNVPELYSEEVVVLSLLQKMRDTLKILGWNKLIAVKSEENMDLIQNGVSVVTEFATDYLPHQDFFLFTEHLGCIIQYSHPEESSKIYKYIFEFYKKKTEARIFESKKTDWEKANMHQQRGETECGINMLHWIFQDPAETEKVWGKDQRKMLNIKHAVAFSNFFDDDFEKAHESLKSVYEEQVICFGEHDPDSLVTYQDLASSLEKLGKLEESLGIQQNVLNHQEKSLGSFHPDTLNTKHCIVSILNLQGKLKEAESLAKEIYEKTLEIFGKTHPFTKYSLEKNAEILEKLGHYGGALKLYQDLQSTEILRNDPDLSTSIKIARITFSMGDYQQALQLFQDILKQQENAPLPSSPAILATKMRIAFSKQALGYYKEAIEILEAVKSQQAQSLGEDNLETVNTCHCIGVSYLHMGKYSDAQQIFQQVLSKQQVSSLGRENLTVATTMHNLACALQSLEDYGNALVTYEEALEIKTKLQGENHLDTLATKMAYGVLLSNIDRLEEACEILENVFKHEKEILGERNPRLLTTRHNLASTYGDMGQYEKAMTDLQEILELRKSILPENHPDILTTEQNIALNLQRSGLNDEGALRKCRSLLKKQNLVLGKDHPRTIKTQQCIRQLEQRMPK